jgi:hypothetical protein
MKTTVQVLQMCVRVLALVLLVLGFGFWARQWYSLVPLHMRLGEFLVLLLWIIAILAIRAKVSRGLIAVAFVWGLLTVYFGMNMNYWVPGRAHEVIRVVHFLIGLGTIGLAEALSGRIKKQMKIVAI